MDISDNSIESKAEDVIHDKDYVKFKFSKVYEKKLKLKMEI